MLKIKDDADLKRLEEFEFKFMECDNKQYYTKQFVDADGWSRAYWVDIEKKQIELETDNLVILLDDTLYDLIQARISRKNRRKEVIGEMGEREYNLWLVLLVVLKNSIAITCFTILAITFNIWWIALFSILFMSSVESEKEDK